MIALNELVLELTDACPQECLHCSSNSGLHRQSHLAPDVVSQLLKEAAQLKAAQVSFGGGEPFCSPLLQQALQTALSLGMKAEVFTCGVIPEPQGMAPLPRHVIQQIGRLTNVKLVFSVHGASEDLHDQVTQRAGSFRAMLAALDHCIAAKVETEINFVPMRLNLHAFGDVVQFFAARGITKASVLRFVPQGRGLANRGKLELSAREEDAFVAELLRLRRHNPMAIRTGSPFNGIVPGNRAPCRAGGEKIVVQADGNVLPCEVFKHKQTHDWGLSVYGSHLHHILASPQLCALRNLLSRGNCLVCPVHSTLRSLQARGASDASWQIPQATLQV